jgi:predicted NodU family carbamoyl transferase
LVIGGGVAMNCSMIGALWQSGKFQDIHVPPFANDAGVSLGAALVVRHNLAPQQWLPLPRVHDVYWGCDIDKNVGAQRAVQHGLHVRTVPPDMLASDIAQRIRDGEVVGWAQGRAEVGQRALGARSIIGDPRDRRNLVRINKLKGREPWRPLAPSVHHEYGADLFVGKLPPAAEFMLAACPVRADAARTIPACTHADMSARPQLVSRATTPRYFDVIDEFRRLTGVPAIINTSFNLAGEAIVNDGTDAVDTFLRCDLNTLVLDNLVITKSVQPAGGS